MAQEREIKIQLKISLEDFIKRIKKKGYKLIHKLNQVDIYFDTKNWFLYENIAALRLRQIDSKNYSFSFKDEVTIDDAENVGIIVELECLNNEPLHIVKTLLDDNEWERSLEGTSYIWLKNVKGLTSHLKNLERFKTEPDWNVWDNEKEMYDKIAE